MLLYFGKFLLILHASQKKNSANNNFNGKILTNRKKNELTDSRGLSMRVSSPQRTQG